MQGIAIQSTKNKFTVTFDKNVYDENTLSSWISFIEIENLAKKLILKKKLWI